MYNRLIFHCVHCARCLFLAISIAIPSVGGELEMQTTRQIPVAGFPGQFHRVRTTAPWQSESTALILCDVWDSHHCVNAVRRVQEIAPRLEAMAEIMRANGATIIHAPSDCMTFYASHPARLRAQSIPKAANLPKDISTWCDQIPSEKAFPYPIDQSDGGEDDDPIEHQQWALKLTSEGRNPRAPWQQQIPIIQIDRERDFVSDSGPEIWSILESKGIKQVLLCGVHTNMCVLGRPFGLRQLASHGKNVCLIRDLTDTMYNPESWPYVDHFSGTDLVIDHVERHVCHTVTSDQVFIALQSKVPTNRVPFRFSKDRRPHLAILIAEDEYDTANTIPQFASTHLQTQLKVSVIHGDTKNRDTIPGLQAIDDADALLVSVRRHPLGAKDLERIQGFVKAGRSVIGIRTASHAFSLRDGKQLDGLVQWPEFDAYAFGGNYTNHHGKDLFPTVSRVGETGSLFSSKGSLYKVSPLKQGARVILNGKIEGQPEEPIAWTIVRADGGWSFYTSLGHSSDFAEPVFQELLGNAVFKACGVPGLTTDRYAEQQLRYSAGKGRQRK